MELRTIQTEGPWNEVAEALNDNFSKIGVAIKSGTGGGGEGGSVSEELVEQIAENTSNIGSNKTKINQLQNQVTVLNSNESTTGSVQNRIKSALEDYVSEEYLEGKGYTSQQDVNNTVDGYLRNYPTRTELQESLADKYAKPSGGIPASDLETSVQASLQRADSSIQENDIYSKTELDTKFGEKLGKEENAASAKKVVGFTENPPLDVNIKAGLLEVFKNANNPQANPTSYGGGLTLLTTNGGFQIAVNSQITYSKNLYARLIAFNEACTEWKQLAYIDDITNNLATKVDKNGGVIEGSITHVIKATGGDATGLEYKSQANELLAGIGTYAVNGKVVRVYIGVGATPWNEDSCISVDAEKAQYGGYELLHLGNYITHVTPIIRSEISRDYYKISEVDELLGGKQDSIDNLATIIENAEKGATALQPDDVYTKEEMGEAIGQEVSNQMRNYYTRKEAQEVFAYKSDLTTKQDKLYSGVNIATINGQSLLDGGNINIGNNGVTDVLKVSLEVSSFAVGAVFSITDAQLNTILQSRSGYTVVVKDGNNTSEWGQVIGCYFLNIGGGVTFYRITIMHHTNDPQATSGDMVMYNMDVMIQPGNSNHECKVISVKTL